jgi:hypothetical protein
VYIRAFNNKNPGEHSESIEDTVNWSGNTYADVSYSKSGGVTLSFHSIKGVLSRDNAISLTWPWPCCVMDIWESNVV